MAILRANRDRIDRAYVERTFAALEEALGQSDLLPAWREVLARVRPE